MNHKDDEVEVNDIRLDANNSKRKAEIEYENIKGKNDQEGSSFEKGEGTKNNFNLEIVGNMQEETQPEKFEVPSHLKKTFICSMVLFFLGLSLFILGFIQQVAAADPGKGITFWTLGGIVMIPGGYYSYQFYRAKKSRNMDDRDNILNDIPEL